MNNDELNRYYRKCCKGRVLVPITKCVIVINAAIHMPILPYYD